MVLQRWNVIATNIQSHACLSILEQIPSALAAKTLSAAISTTSPLAQALCCTLLAETTLSDTETTCHGSKSFGVFKWSKQKNTDKNLHLSHFHSWRFDTLTMLKDRRRSKTVKLVLFFKLSRAAKPNLDRQWVRVHFFSAWLTKAYFIATQYCST